MNAELSLEASGVLPEAGKTVLDLGCNAGYFSIQMKKRGASVVGIDVAPWSIKQAKFIADYFGLEIDYRVANVYQWLLQNKERFDYVLFLGMFYHTHDKSSLMVDRGAKEEIEMANVRGNLCIPTLGLDEV